MYNGNSDMTEEIDLAGSATRNTVGGIARAMGWVLLLLLAVVTAVHAVSITMAYTHLNPAGGNLFAIVRIGGVVLVEFFAVTTAILLMTHQLRARQKPAAMAVEVVWMIFAAVNLVSSFAIEHGGELPQFVNGWVAYGLPVSALVMGVLFYMTLRLDPDAARSDDEAELREHFARIRHGAKLEVMASPQMKSVIRQAEWMTLPGIVGRQLNLSERQIAHLVRQAPELLDLNGNGIADIHEQQPARRLTLAEMQERIADARAREAELDHGGNSVGPYPTMRS